MARGAFDIYQTRSGYTAVESDAQRQILEALAEGDKMLPELVTITGKGKPTLSGTHMKDLIGRELVEEKDHPTDGRRKIFRLIGTRIGASDSPAPQLCKAVEAYASLAPLQGKLPLSLILSILDAASAGTADEVLQAQGQRLGAMLADSLRVSTPRDLWIRFVQWLEDQGVARVAKVDLDMGQLELELLNTTLAPTAHIAHVLAGLEFPGTVAGSVDAGRIVLGYTA